MAIDSINSYTQPVTTTTSSTAKTGSKENTKNTSSQTSAAESTGVVYEKSASDTRTDTSYKTQNASLIAKMKADSNNRLQQLQSIVSQMMSKQGTAIGTADDMWKFLAGGNFTVSAAARAQAQRDIAEDGYWGVAQTSDRIVDFAKALSGGDASKADELLAAVKRVQQATNPGDKTLPDITQRTYDAVVEKFDAWKNENKTTETEETEA